MQKLNDEQIIASWKLNASPWITAIQEGQIESRLLVTNKAIVNTVIQTGARTCLDIGCGEGWLMRELEKSGISSYGIDAIPELIDFARKHGGGEFKLLPYEKLSHETINRSFDVAVCNFSLLGKASVERVFRQVPALLNNGGFFIVQTIHPVAGCGELGYQNNWRQGSWSGFSADFSNPPPWYFRTLEEWQNLYIKNGFLIKEIIEPLNPKTQTPASILFIGLKGC